MNHRELEDRYTLQTYTKYPFALVRGQGSYVEDEAGNRYLDLYGGHAVCVLGHSHPRWVEALALQAREFGFYSNVCYHPLRAEASKLLVEKSYPSMSAVFFCNSGAEANENALKIARGATGRRIVVAMEAGFHGRTIGALSVTGIQKLRDTTPENIANWTRFVPLGDVQALESLEAQDIAAVILEPVQSMAGVKMAPESYYRALREYCDQHGVVLIFDEVQTGNGRTGKWFVGHHWGVEPDLVTTAKGVGGGFPVGAVIANRRLADTVKPGDQGTTFGGGPLAAAAVVATYGILDEEGLVDRVAELSPEVFRRLGDLRGRGVREVRGLGYLIGVECEGEAKTIQRMLLEEKILVGSSSDARTFRLLPPLNLSAAEWDRFLDVFERVLRQVSAGQA